MPDSLREPNETEDGKSAKDERPKRIRWQVGLRSLLLLMAAVAVWTVHCNNRRQNAKLEAKIKSIRPLAHELLITDATKINVVKLEETWYDENRWEVYLPDGKYRLSLALHEIDQEGFAPVVQSDGINPGKHRIKLEQLYTDNKPQIIVYCDGARLLAAEESKDWNLNLGSQGGSNYDQSSQFPADKPLVLFRRRFRVRGPNNQSITPTGPTNGILLWIEPESKTM